MVRFSSYWQARLRYVCLHRCLIPLGLCVCCLSVQVPRMAKGEMCGDAATQGGGLGGLALG